MSKFQDRTASNNKRKLNIIGSDGRIIETQTVEIIRDNEIEGVETSGSLLNENTFTEIEYDTIRRFYNSSTGQTGEVQTFTIESDGIYRIKAAGAKGGKGGGADLYSLTGGYGATVSADFELKAGDVINVVVGQRGGDSSYLDTDDEITIGGGGGGGTFVFRNIETINNQNEVYQYTKDNQNFEVLLVAAGGGGTSACCNNYNKISGTNGDAENIFSIENYQSPSEVIFSGNMTNNTHHGGSIRQYIVYDLIGEMFIGTETVCGGYGGGAITGVCESAGGGWNFSLLSPYTAYSWSIGTDTVGTTGGNPNDHGYCIISKLKIEDNLTSTSKRKSLSANQGKILADTISSISEEMTAINATIATKANVTAMNAALAEKADYTAMNDALATKANASEMNNTIAAINAAIATKAEVSEMSDAIEEINAEIDTKADATAVNNAIETINAAIDTKANASDMTTALATKANAGEMSNAITAINAEIATKSSIADMNDAVSEINQIKASLAKTNISWDSVIANGASGTETSTELTLTFSEDPGEGFTADNITLTGATKGTLSGTGTTRTLAISNITVVNNEAIKVVLSDPQNKTFLIKTRSTPVYIQIRNITWESLVANGEDETETTTELTLTFSEDPGEGFTADNITLTGATKGELSGTGTTRTLSISNITVENNETIEVVISDLQDKIFLNKIRSVSVYIEIRQITWESLVADGVDNETTTTMLTLTFSEDPGPTFTLNKITVTGATIKHVSDIGASITIHIEDIQGGNDSTVTVGISNLQTVAFSTNQMSVSVYVGSPSHTYTLINDGTEYEVSVGEIYSGHIEIPATYNNLPVTAIASDGFANNSEITSVSIPFSVKIIGYNAFCYCYNLTNVTFGEGSQLETIDYYAFYECTLLEEISIPDMVISIGSYAFYNCYNLTFLTIGEESQLETIEDYAFYNCSEIKELFIPESVTYVGDTAFYGWTSNQIIYLYETNKSSWHYYWEADCNAFYINDNLRENGSGGFDVSYYCDEYNNEGYEITAYNNGDSIVVIPKFINGEPVIRIADNAFQGKTDIIKVIMPDSIVTIGYGAFKYCSNLSYLRLSSNLLEIWEEAFGECTSLSNLRFPAGLLHIKDYAFQGCTGLTEIKFPIGLLSIGDSAFYGCIGLTDIQFSNGLLNIGDSAFYGCNGLTDIQFSNGLLSIGYYAFQGCNSLTEIQLPNSLLEIGYSAFNSCTQLEYVSLPIELQSIQNGAFDNCTNLKSITLPSTNVLSSGNEFYDCPILTIYTDAESTEVFDAFFNSCSMVCNCTFSNDQAYVVSFTYNGEFLNNNQNIQRPYRDGYWLVGWRTDNEVYDNPGYWNNGIPGYEYYEFDMNDFLSNDVEIGTTYIALWQHI